MTTDVVPKFRKFSSKGSDKFYFKISLKKENLYEAYMDHFESRDDRWVEGIGNEVVLFASCVGVLAATVLFYIFSRHDQNVEIHPDSADFVNATRDQLIHAATEGPDDGRRRASTRNNGELQCPICLGEAAFAVETNCGHVYCANCIITYWGHQTWMGAVRCPSCRTEVTILLLNFTSNEHAIDSEEKRDLIQKINSYNRRFSGEPRSLQEYLQDLPTLLRHAASEFFSMTGLMWMFRLRVGLLVLAAVLYLVSPLDILPEAAFGALGFLDDVFIFLLLAVYISIFYRQLVAQRGDG